MGSSSEDIGSNVVIKKSFIGQFSMGKGFSQIGTSKRGKW